ncbi:hypothetical protein [Kocuria sp.]|uniref:hypothetical protein n=1 Tax=Kocuria sp. TaxID=1871328 RepID=UPI0026DD1A11|nr:hypothetical protein [Kocuria sp.]MDO4919936.1 hypothetical protein [Kocuria sp.]
MMLVQGTQSPRVSMAPVGEWSESEDCADLAAQYGLTPDPWQRNVLDAWMRRGADDRWAAGRWGVAVPRQNGKNGLVEMVELYFMVILGLRVLHTAHEVKTARKAFLRILSFFENERQYPELAAMVKGSPRKTNGQEAIFLHAPGCGRGENCGCKGGGSVEFIARSKSSGRGFTVDVLICDEAQEYGDDAQAALLPTISSAPSGDPLQILLGTPPGPGMDGTVFTRLREGGLSEATRTAWCEWSCKPGVEVGDRAEWFASNPSLGIRLNLSTVEDEFGAMSPETFARERLGVWDTGANGSAAFNFTQWQSLTGEPPADAVRVFGVKFSADGSHVSLAGCMKPKEGPLFVEGIASRPMSEGTQWLVDFLVERKADTAQIVIDGRSGVGFLVEALREAGVGKRVLLTPTVGEVVTAHTMFDQAITEATLTHSGQALLGDEIRDVTRRPIGTLGGFGWAAMTTGGSVGLVDAVTLAHWGARTTKRKPGRKQVMM